MTIKEMYELAVKDGCENAQVFFASSLTNVPTEIREAFVWCRSGLTNNPEDKILLLR